ncbi:MAG: hypothetical protein GWN01_11405, partial [Nitrosopumilaceae archaeon]|nr:hypothetical protein [Nitrosopumilaceae archaeon]NIU87916.1 hypothetical protein [Nitrosopumilaceae archaeon]NIV66204.1 hypothetical protein [Nitrosopumilaceae archaeon]NIX62091.1 hypothetical protein [Nitrosopumilaceae archaeon]
VGILHRFLLTENANSIIGKCEKHDISPICISMGSNVSSYVIVEPLINEYNIDCVCIDVAHGDCKKVLECIYYMKQSFPDISIIAGNVCTSQA